MLQPVFNLLAPQTQSSNTVKAHAINTVNMLIVTGCASVRQYMQEYSVHILGLYQDLTVDQQLKLRILEGLTTVLEFEDEVILANLQSVMQTMTKALKEYDQVIALAASEFFASLVQVWFTAAHDDASNPTLNQKVDQMKQWLPQMLPELLICSKLSEADKRNIIQTKEEDLFLELGDGKVNDTEEELDQEDDEDYTVGRGGASNTTLRQSAAYALAQFSKTF